nr:hypothetical protein [Mucilaginibacter sp. FT3.2]
MLKNTKFVISIAQCVLIGLSTGEMAKAADNTNTHLRLNGQNGQNSNLPTTKIAGQWCYINALTILKCPKMTK